ncbi:Na/Pi symporter, partial [bacterium]|nr:Na/Pi symporter [bacterium]
MKVMSEGVQKFAGAKMRAALSSITGNRFKGVLTGLVTTGLVQSSSATTVLVVSFVNVGLLTLVESIGVIMGANLGTTLTAWIIAAVGKFSVAKIAVPIIGVGFPLFFVGKGKWKSFGEFVLGFGLLFLGLGELKDAVPDLKSGVKSDQGVIDMITYWIGLLSDKGYLTYVLFMIAGVVLTLVVQSSSAAMAIPLILDGKDVIGASQTGTGKTAAFALPSLSKIEPIGKPQILVLEPTRELADQVADQFLHYGNKTGCKVALLYGGVGHGKQDEQLKAGADIVVATPGRLVDHFYRGTMKFKEIKILILDEVDRMLDMGFLPQVRKIINICPWNNDEQTRQTLFFSATMPPVIAGFAEWCLTDPETVEIARREVAATVSHAFFPVAMTQRDELLLGLLEKTNYDSLMIFTRTRKEADVIT